MAESDWAGRIRMGYLLDLFGRVRIGDVVRHAVVRIPDNRQGPFAWYRGVGCDAAFGEETMQNVYGNQQVAGPIGGKLWTWREDNSWAKVA